nr:putative reverse transcriptase domain-containing protein [Tanacetum cinerariifolium]
MMLSTAKEEYVSLFSYGAQVIWMRTQLTDYGFHFNKIPIYCDSKSAIPISCNPVQHSRTKHIVVRYHCMKEHVEKGTSELYFVKTDYQLADLFTKFLLVDRFNYLVRRLDDLTLRDGNLSMRVTKEEHEVYLKIMIELLKKEKLYAKFSKCECWLQEVQFLRHVVNQDGIHVDPSKVELVKNWMTLKSPTEFRSFLVLAGYYRRFIKNFSKIAKPLTLLTQKNKKYEWGAKQEEAFRILKEELCNDPVLALLDGPSHFVVYCDTSNQGFRQWIELLTDYKCEIRYHSGKENVMADALSRKKRLKPWRVCTMSMTIQFGLKAKILEAQGKASKNLTAPIECLQGLDAQFERRDDEVRESQLIGLKIIKEATKKIMKIKEMLKMARDRQKTYADKRRKPLEFNAGNHVPVAYRFRLTHELSSIYETFHLSNLKKCLADASLQVPLEEIKIDDKLRFVEEPFEIMDREVKKRKRKIIPIVKVRWNS